MSKKQAQDQNQGRVYKSEYTFEHDLYVLDVQDVVKNVEWNPDAKPMYEAFPHKHMFHSYDSDGRQQTRCNAAVGHFHEIELVSQGEGKPPLAKCGPAVKEVMKKQGNTYKKIIQELQGREAHTHKVIYKNSERLRSRQTNPEAIKLQSQIITKQSANMTAEERAATRDNPSRDGSAD